MANPAPIVGAFDVRVSRPSGALPPRPGARVAAAARSLHPTLFVRARGALAALAALAVAALLGWPALARAEPFALAGTDWEGCSELVRLARAELGPDHVVVADRIDFEKLEPRDAVLMLHPERSVDSGELAKFMKSGGRVLLLDDFGKGDGLLQHFGMARIPLPAAPAESLRQNPNLALAEPSSPHPVVADVRRVVTNHATGIRHPDLSPVLSVQPADRDQPAVPVAVAGAVGKGRLLVIADPSIVMNSMLRYAGNKALARGLARYALEDDTWGTRGGRLVMVSGAFTSEGHFGGNESRLASALDALRELARELRTQGMPPAMAFSLAIGAGVALLVWIARRASKLHHAQVPRFTRGVPTVAHGGVAGHAAVVSSKHASRVLGMLELKQALEEQLCQALELDALPPQAELVRAVEHDRLLDAQGLAALRRVLLKMATVETLILAQRGSAPPPYKDRDLVEAATDVKRIVQDVERTRAARRAEPA